jgi:MraZ protein
MRLKGEYYHAIDDKSRLTIPAKLRESINTAEEGYGLVAIPLFDRLLYLYTPKTYEGIAPHFDTKLEANADVRNLKRLRYGLAQDVEVDRLGRVLIPENTLKRCGLGKEVVLVGAEDHIEVWPRQRWEAFVAQEFAHHDELAERVAGIESETGASSPLGAAPGPEPAPGQPKHV